MKTESYEYDEMDLDDGLDDAQDRADDEPGTPPRSMSERGELDWDDERDTLEVVERKGSTPRGDGREYREREEGKNRPLDISPSHLDDAREGELTR